MITKKPRNATLPFAPIRLYRPSCFLLSLFWVHWGLSVTLPRLSFGKSLSHYHIVLFRTPAVVILSDHMLLSVALFLATFEYHVPLCERCLAVFNLCRESRVLTCIYL
jgi:hypothetical protein